MYLPGSSGTPTRSTSTTLRHQVAVLEVQSTRPVARLALPPPEYTVFWPGEPTFLHVPSLYFCCSCTVTTACVAGQSPFIHQSCLDAANGVEERWTLSPQE